jgi:Lectin C-type domain
MTPTPTLPARVPAAHPLAARRPRVGSVSWLLLGVSTQLLGCVGERFEGGDPPAASTSNSTPQASSTPAASSATPAASASLSTPAGTVSTTATSPALSASVASVMSSTAPAPDAGTVPPEAGVPPREEAGPACPAWGCPLTECPERADVLSPYGVCYFTSENARWAEARNACANRGTGWKLLTIRSEEEHQFASNELLVGATWLGASDEQTPDQWTWLGDESPFFIGVAEQGAAQGGAFVRWSEGEPSNLVPDEQCARYEQGRDGLWLWGDFTCTRVFRVICELRGG